MGHNIWVFDQSLRGWVLLWEIKVLQASHSVCGCVLVFSKGFCNFQRVFKYHSIEMMISKLLKANLVVQSCLISGNNFLWINTGLGSAWPHVLTDCPSKGTQDQRRPGWYVFQPHLKKFMIELSLNWYTQTIRGFINIFSRGASGFHWLAKLYQPKFFV